MKVHNYQHARYQLQWLLPRPSQRRSNKIVLSEHRQRMIDARRFRKKRKKEKKHCFASHRNGLIPNSFSRTQGLRQCHGPLCLAQNQTSRPTYSAGLLEMKDGAPRISWNARCADRSWSRALWTLRAGPRNGRVALPSAMIPCIRWIIISTVTLAQGVPQWVGKYRKLPKPWHNSCIQLLLAFLIEANVSKRSDEE